MGKEKKPKKKGKHKSKPRKVYENKKGRYIRVGKDKKHYYLKQENMGKLSEQEFIKYLLDRLLPARRKQRVRQPPKPKEAEKTEKPRNQPDPLSLLNAVRSDQNRLQEQTKKEIDKDTAVIRKELEATKEKQKKIGEFTKKLRDQALLLTEKLKSKKQKELERHISEALRAEHASDRYSNVEVNQLIDEYNEEHEDDENFQPLKKIGSIGGTKAQLITKLRQLGKLPTDEQITEQIKSRPELQLSDDEVEDIDPALLVDEEKEEGKKEEVKGDEKVGSGKNLKFDKNLRLTNIDLDKIMRKYKDYLGTIPVDGFQEIAKKVKPHSRIGLIVNTDPHNMPGEHWQAIFADARPHGSNSIEFYDSYGQPASKAVMKGMKLLVDKLNPPEYLRFKENKIRKQGVSSNCGWFCAKWLMDRFRGLPFAEVTGYNDAVQGEKNIEKFKQQFPQFGYFIN